MFHLISKGKVALEDVDLTKIGSYYDEDPSMKEESARMVLEYGNGINDDLEDNNSTLEERIMKIFTKINKKVKKATKKQ